MTELYEDFKARNGFGINDKYYYGIRRNGMNYSSAVMLVNPNIRAVHVVYEPDVEGKPKNQRYTFKTLDPELKEGDYVVVPTDTRHNFTVVRVVDTDVDVDFDSPTQLKWVVAKVDLAQHELVLQEEGKAISAIKASEKRRKREEIRKNLLDMHEEDLAGLAITNMGAPAAIAAQPVNNK